MTKNQTPIVIFAKCKIESQHIFKLNSMKLLRLKYCSIL